jgi:iron complex transport system ATP-binding protein
MLETRDATVRYPGAREPSLDGVGMSLAAGELVAVVGPNGCGKTTLLRALLGLVPLERGEARVLGRPVAEWPRRELAQVIGVVSQREEPAFPLRVEDVVMLGRYARLSPLGAPSAEDREAVRAALEQCDAWDLRNRSTDGLSGGEWQRVRVARALAQAPRALVLDEPTASLDVRHEMELFELVAALVHGGLGALVVTHQLNLAARYARRLLLLGGGRLVAAGAPREVLRREALEEVFRWPVAVATWQDGAPQVVPLRPGESGA